MCIKRFLWKPNERDFFDRDVVIIVYMVEKELTDTSYSKQIFNMCTNTNGSIHGDPLIPGEKCFFYKYVV